MPSMLDDTCSSNEHTHNSSCLLSATLLSSSSPSSPASSKIYMRNILGEYIDEVRSLLRHLHEITAAGLPYIYPQAVEDSLDSVVDWVEKEDPGEMDLRLALERLEDEMAACGITLYLEVLAKESRQRYFTTLEEFKHWLYSTQHKTGGDQPLSPAERAIMTDFVELETRWAERPENITAHRREFVERTCMLRELRNDDRELRERNELIAGVLAVLDDGSNARRRRLYQHVAHRAAVLRATPKDNLSAKQRRDCKTIATAVMAWLDEHRDAEDMLDELADQLQRVCETSQETSAAADIVARRNELVELLDFIRMSTTTHRQVMDALGPDRVEALSFVVGKCEHWLEANPNPSIQTLEKFVESLRLAASKYGLSPPTMDAPVPAPDSVKAAAAGPATPSDEAARGRAVEHAEKVLVMNVACVVLEELQVLRVACAAGGASAFIARRIAPLQVEVQDVLSDSLAMGDGAAPLLRRYKDTLKAARAEAPHVSIPPSCWTHVLPFDNVELDD